MKNLLSARASSSPGSFRPFVLLGNQRLFAIINELEPLHEVGQGLNHFEYAEQRDSMMQADREFKHPFRYNRQPFDQPDDQQNEARAEIEHGARCNAMQLAQDGALHWNGLL